MDLPVIGYANLVSDALPIGAGIASRRHKELGMSLFLLYVLLGGTTEGVSFWMATARINNHWLLTVYHLSEYVLLTSILLLWHKQKPGMKSLKAISLQVSIPLFVLLWIYAKLSFEPFNLPDSMTHSVASLVFIAAGILVLKDLVGQERSDPMIQDCRFWISVGVLLYFSGSLMFFMLGQEIVQLHFLDALSVYTVHWAVNITVNIIYAIAFLFVKR